MIPCIIMLLLSFTWTMEIQRLHEWKKNLFFIYISTGLLMANDIWSGLLCCWNDALCRSKVNLHWTFLTDSFALYEFLFLPTTQWQYMRTRYQKSASSNCSVNLSKLTALVVDTVSLHHQPCTVPSGFC